MWTGLGLPDMLLIFLNLSFSAECLLVYKYTLVMKFPDRIITFKSHSFIKIVQNLLG